MLTSQTEPEGSSRADTSFSCMLFGALQCAGASTLVFSLTNALIMRAQTPVIVIGDFFSHCGSQLNLYFCSVC